MTNSVHIFDDRRLLCAAGASFFLALLGFALLLWKIAPLGTANNVIALHYNVFFGVDAIGDSRRLFFLPIISVIITFGNTALAALVYEKEPTGAYALLFGSLATSVLLFLSTLFITLVNLA